jgi:hypothetical protein
MKVTIDSVTMQQVLQPLDWHEDDATGYIQGLRTACGYALRLHMLGHGEWPPKPSEKVEDEIDVLVVDMSSLDIECSEDYDSKVIMIDTLPVFGFSCDGDNITAMLMLPDLGSSMFTCFVIGTIKRLNKAKNVN